MVTKRRLPDGPAGLLKREHIRAHRDAPALQIPRQRGHGGNVQADGAEIIRAGEDLPGWAVHDDPPSVHDHHPGRQGRGFLHTMRDEHHGDAVPVVKGLDLP